MREPEAQYVLIMETSASMDSHNQWKWVNKAAQKFIRYDLPLHSNLAIVTFSNQSRVAHVMSAIHSDEARARLADTVPDKYHLSHTDVKCLLCGVQQAIQEVLRGNMAGAHLVLLTRGSPDTLSISDEQTIEDYVKYYHLKVSSILIPESQKLPLGINMLTVFQTLTDLSNLHLKIPFFSKLNFPLFIDNLARLFWFLKLELHQLKFEIFDHF